MQLWVDPGDTSGVLIGTSTSVERTFTVHKSDMAKFLKGLFSSEYSFNVIGYEGYFIRPDTAYQNIGTVSALQIIGMLKLVACYYDIEATMQPPTIKKAATKWAGVNMPKQHSKTHVVDAYLHWYYHNFKAGHIQTTLQPIFPRKE